MSLDSHFLGGVALWGRSFASEADATKMRAIEKLCAVLRMQLGQIP